MLQKGIIQTSNSRQGYIQSYHGRLRDIAEYVIEVLIELIVEKRRQVCDSLSMNIFRFCPGIGTNGHNIVSDEPLHKTLDKDGNTES